MTASQGMGITGLSNRECRLSTQLGRLRGRPQGLLRGNFPRSSTAGVTAGERRFRPFDQPLFTNSRVADKCQFSPEREPLVSKGTTLPLI
jgi:hypothetical protein